MRKPATVATSGVTLFSQEALRPLTNWSKTDPWGKNVLLVGRFLCFSYYRDPERLVEEYPQLMGIFEDAIRQHPPWGELLAGAYRGALTPQANLLSGQAKRRNGKGVVEAHETNAGKKGIVKYPHLGTEVKAGIWKNKVSIDGKGLVRTLEVCLYQFVATRFLDSLTNKS